jgi:hypothetical protein
LPIDWIGAIENIRVVPREDNMLKGRGSIEKNLNEMIERKWKESR